MRRIQNIEWIKKIFAGELKNPDPPPDSIHTNLLDIVQDLPKEVLDTKSYRIFLRNPITRKSRELLDAENFSDFQISDRKQVYSRGEYNPACFNFLTFGSQYDRNDAYLQLIDKEGYRELYLVVNLSIKVIGEDSLQDKDKEYYQSHLGAEELDCGSLGIIQ